MDRDYKILGQAIPAAGTDTTLYTVNTGKYGIVSSFMAVNQNKVGDPVEIRVAVVPAGDVLAAKHYIVYDALIDVRETINLPVGMSLAAGSKIIIRVSVNTVSFTACGVESTAI